MKNQVPKFSTERTLVWDKSQMGGQPFDQIVICNHICRFILIWAIIILALLFIFYGYMELKWKLEVAAGVAGGVFLILFILLWTVPIWEAIIADFEHHCLVYKCYGICCCCRNKEARFEEIEKGYVVYGVLRKTRGICNKEDYYCHDLYVILKGVQKIPFMMGFWELEPATLRTFIRTYINFDDDFIPGEAVLQYGSYDLDVCHMVEDYKKKIEMTNLNENKKKYADLLLNAKKEEEKEKEI